MEGLTAGGSSPVRSHSLQKTMNLGMDTGQMLSRGTGSHTALIRNCYHLRVTAQCDMSRGANALANEIPECCWVPSPQHIIKIR